MFVALVLAARATRDMTSFLVLFKYGSYAGAVGLVHFTSKRFEIVRHHQPEGLTNEREFLSLPLAVMFMVLGNFSALCRSLPRSAGDCLKEAFVPVYGHLLAQALFAVWQFLLDVPRNYK